MPLLHLLICPGVLILLLIHGCNVDFSTINCEEIDMGDGTGYKFLPTEAKVYPFLHADDTAIMDTVIQRFGSVPKAEIVETMHQEDAYTETAPGDIIQFKYAKTLSIS